MVVDERSAALALLYSTPGELSTPILTLTGSSTMNKMVVSQREEIIVSLVGKLHCSGKKENPLWITAIMRVNQRGEIFFWSNS